MFIIQPLNFGIINSMESTNDESRELSLLEQIESVKAQIKALRK